MALKESPPLGKLSTCLGRFFIAKAEQLTPQTPLSPSKNAFNKVNARLFSCFGLISGRCSQNIDRKFMVRLIAARLPAAPNWLVLAQPPNPALALPQRPAQRRSQPVSDYKNLSN
jgi:hypothetical protein